MGAARWPRTAVAAATSGDTRCVRAPLPCRPSKLRLDVEALRSPGGQLVRVHAQAHRAAGVAPLRAAAMKTLSRPSASASSRTRAEPGTTSIVTPSATVRPESTAAADRRSSMRPLVHEPTKTVSTWMSRSGVPGCQVHVLEGPLGRGALLGVGERVGRRARRPTAADPGRGWSPR